MNTKKKYITEQIRIIKPEPPTHSRIIVQRFKNGSHYDTSLLEGNTIITTFKNRATFGRWQASELGKWFVDIQLRTVRDYTGSIDKWITSPIHRLLPDNLAEFEKKSVPTTAPIPHING